MSDLGQKPLDSELVHVVVLGHEDGQGTVRPFQGPGSPFRIRSGAGHGKGQGYPHGRAASERTVQGDGAAHEAGQALDDGQPEPHPAGRFGGGLADLHKAVENGVAHVRGNAPPGVGHGKAYPQLPAGEFGLPGSGRDSDTAGIGVFDCVADQIEQDLAQAGIVADQAGRQAVVEIEGQGEALFTGHGRENIEHGLAHLPG